jgi:CheY-like chemotaxis protein
MLTYSHSLMRTEAPFATADILLLADGHDEIARFKDAADSARVSVVENCPSVLGFLRREPPYRDQPRPDLILLDLDLSNSEHCDTLRHIKEDRNLRRIPVIVLAREDPRSVADAYSLYANAYIAKPADPVEYVRIMKATLHFWLKLARLPKE